MVSKKAQKRRQGVKTYSIQPSTPRGPAEVTPRAMNVDEGTQRSAQRNATDTRSGEVTHTGDAVASTESSIATRKEEIEALPTFQEATGLQAVEAGITLYVVPLRSGAAKECYFEETSNATSIGQKTQKMIEYVDSQCNVSRRARPDTSAQRCQSMGR